MEHIAKVLDVAETFEKDLKGGSGYEGTSSLNPNPTISSFLMVDLAPDAMRSYT